MRLLVSADIHLGSPIRSVAMRNPDLGNRLKQASRDTFAEIVSLAISEQVDALVLAGDIFDNGYPDMKSRAFLITQLARAAEAGVRKGTPLRRSKCNIQLFDFNVVLNSSVYMTCIT